MNSVCVMKLLLERGVIVIHVLEEPLLGELWVSQGLCEGLDISLHKVVVCGLITCEEVGFVSRVSPSPFKRSTQCYYCPQGCGISAGGSAGDWR